MLQIYCRRIGEDGFGLRLECKNRAPLPERRMSLDNVAGKKEVPLLMKKNNRKSNSVCSGGGSFAKPQNFKRDSKALAARPFCRVLSSLCFAFNGLQLSLATTLSRLGGCHDVVERPGSGPGRFKAHRAVYCNNTHTRLAEWYE